MLDIIRPIKTDDLSVKSRDDITNDNDLMSGLIPPVSAEPVTAEKTAEINSKTVTLIEGLQKKETPANPSKGQQLKPMTKAELKNLYYKLGQQARFTVHKTWPLLLLTGAIIALLVLYAGFPVINAVVSFVALTILYAWYASPAEEDVQSSNNPIKRRKSKKERIEQDVWTQLIESIPDPIFILGPQNRLLHANNQAQSIFGTTRTGQSISSIVRTPKLLEAISSVYKTHTPKKFQLTERTPIERQFSVNISWISKGKESDGPAILIHFRDLTEQERLNRMRADFIANASHELRTPIASLLGFIETLQGPARNDEAARDKFLSIMADQGRRMTGLVDDLLSLSRVEMNAHKIPQDKIDLVSILRATIDSLAPLAADQTITLELAPITQEYIVLGDKDELSQVFQNLIHNAIKYGREKGHVWVRFSELASDKNHQKKICVEIEDDGLGIEAHHIPRLTERFYRVDVEQSRQKGGTGLGLAITKHIIGHHRGELKIRSELGKGSVFSVMLPKA